MDERYTILSNIEFFKQIEKSIVTISTNLAITALFCNNLNRINNIIDSKECVTISTNDQKKDLFAKLGENQVKAILLSSDNKAFLIPLPFFKSKDSREFTVSELRNILKGENNGEELYLIEKESIKRVLTGILTQEKVPGFLKDKTLMSVIVEMTDSNEHFASLETDANVKILACEEFTKLNSHDEIKVTGLIAIDENDISVSDKNEGSTKPEPDENAQVSSDVHPENFDAAKSRENIPEKSFRQATKEIEMSNKDQFRISLWDENGSNADGLDWLSNSSYLLGISGNLTDKMKIQRLVGAIKNQATRTKIISELSVLDQDNLDMEKFVTIFKGLIKRDLIVYRNELSELKYEGKTSMREFYTRLYILVVRATGLNEITDKESLTKMVSNNFIEKLPTSLRKQLITQEDLVGYPLADFAERVRSFARVYLNEEKVEVNHFKNPRTYDKSTRKETRSCFNCGIPGHLASICRKPKKDRGHQQANQSKVVCEFCQKPGHSADKCYKKGDSQNQCTFCQRKGHTEDKCYKKRDSGDKCSYCQRTGHSVDRCYKQMSDRENGRGELPTYRRDQ